MLISNNSSCHWLLISSNAEANVLKWEERCYCHQSLLSLLYILMFRLSWGFWDPYIVPIHCKFPPPYVHFPVEWHLHFPIFSSLISWVILDFQVNFPLTLSLSLSREWESPNSQQMLTSCTNCCIAPYTSLHTLVTLPMTSNNGILCTL